MLGTCLIQLGDFNRAEDYLNQALDFYGRTEMRPYLVRTLFTLAQLYERQRRVDDAQDARARAETILAALTEPFVDN